MNTETITLNVKTFHVPSPAHAGANWSACLCDDCWRDWIEECARQDDGNPDT